MSLKVANKLGLGFGVALLIFIIVGISAYLTIDKQSESEWWHTHTHEVIEQILLVESYLKDAETGQRGYLLTGKEYYLEPYETGIKNVNDVVDTLSTITRDNSRQQVTIEKTRDLVGKKLDELQQTIDLFQRNEKDAALAIVLSDAGKNIMDAIRKEISFMKDDEMRLLEERKRNADQSAHITRKTIVYGMAFSIIAIFISAFLIERSITKPLGILVENTRLLAHGDYAKTKRVVSKDEIGELARSFDQMAESLANKEEILVQERKRLEYIIKGTNIGTWEWNVQTGDVIFNERWAQIIGYTLEELAPLSIKVWEQFCHPDDYKESNNLLEEHFKEESDYYECEARMRHKNREWVWVLDRGKVLSWADDGTPLLMYGTHADITDRKKNEATIVHLANHDPLTGLPTRRMATDRLDMAIRLAQRHKELAAVFYIDLDGFKDINDKYGHVAGDAVLVGVAERFLSILRKNDTVARLGGDEFLVVITELKVASNAALVAEKLLQCLSQPIAYNGEQLRIGASIGISIYPDNSTEIEELITHADQAMYATKNSGKNGYQFAQPVK